jgi:hypothetical protein
MKYSRAIRSVSVTSGVGSLSSGVNVMDEINNNNKPSALRMHYVRSLNRPVLSLYRVLFGLPTNVRTYNEVVCPQTGLQAGWQWEKKKKWRGK